MKYKLLKPVFIVLLFAGLGFGAYSNTLNVPFCFDDNASITENPHIRVTRLSEIVSAGFRSSFTRPIAYMSFALNYYFHQYDLFGYHLVNIIIHILTGTFLFLFIKTTLELPLLRDKFRHADAIAFITALVWLVHPLHTQSVTYIVQRMNSMAAMFFILSLFLYVKGRLATERKNSWLWFVGSVLAWLLSLGCKQTSATLPFFVFLYEWYFFQDLNLSWLSLRLKYLAGILILFVLVIFLYLGSDPFEKITSLRDYAHNEFTFTQRILTQSRVVVYYISLLLYPHPSRLNLDYDFPLSHSLIDPITTLIGLCCIIVLIGLAIVTAKKHRLISFCILWFLGNLVIESSVIPLAIIFEHRTYLPSMLVFLPAATLAYKHIEPKWIGIVLLCITVAIFSTWTFKRNRVWENEFLLWKDCVTKSPTKARPHYNFGVKLEERNRTVEAIHSYSEAIRLKPDYAEAYNNMGNALAAQGKPSEAEKNYAKALKIDPDFAEAYNNLGNALAAQGKLLEAIQRYSEALRLKPDFREAQLNLDKVISIQKQIRAAIADTEQKLALYPDNPGLYYTLGNLYKDMGEFETAAKQYQKALFLRPDFVEAANNLAIIYLKESEPEKALAMFEKISELDPDNTAAYYNVACIHSRLNRVDLAVDWLKKAVERGYDNWEIIKTDADLDNIRDSAYYKELVKNR